MSKSNLTLAIDELYSKGMINSIIEVSPQNYNLTILNNKPNKKNITLYSLEKKETLGLLQNAKYFNEPVYKNNRNESDIIFIN